MTWLGLMPQLFMIKHFIKLFWFLQ
ncbi:hypothetical protein HNQ37_000659 [Lactovum miscens]|uniref:Uncharacterized protein n=1 Tax=Lactovum miscens TaxID=190387 RepID=A0A841C5R3_9LACT|nr:hypothetical protein [Lactovum miscens]